MKDNWAVFLQIVQVVGGVLIITKTAMDIWERLKGKRKAHRRRVSARRKRKR